MRTLKHRLPVFFLLGLGGGFLMAILSGCGAFAPGSPNVAINKNVTVTINGPGCGAEEERLCYAGDVFILYSTKSETGITSKIEQQLEDLLDATLKAPLLP